jgi:hypothetical protein
MHEKTQVTALTVYSSPTRLCRALAVTRRDAQHGLRLVGGVIQENVEPLLLTAADRRRDLRCVVGAGIDRLPGVAGKPPASAAGR